jgi:hypothetical protein
MYKKEHYLLALKFLAFSLHTSLQIAEEETLRLPVNSNTN